MSVLKEILKWSQDLPAWQSDAIARLFAKGSLSDADFDDLLALLKSEHGIADSDGRVAKRLSEDQIPAGSSASTDIKLIAIKDLSHVNRVAAKQRLPFSTDGLTVIYGDNGSGKSGYSRVLKRACRARDQSEEIHPNAFLPATATGSPQAVFEVQIGGVAQEVAWVNGHPAPEVLSSMAVFDSQCARSYLDEEGDFAYVPYGLDILEALAGVFKKLKTAIEAEIAQLTVDNTAFADLAGGTAVGKLIAELSHKTPPARVLELAVLDPAETACHEQLRKALEQANPGDKARQLRLLIGRLSRLAETVRQKCAAVGDEEVVRLRGLTEGVKAAKAAADQAAQALREDSSLLPGTGGDVWRGLFEAARKFSLEAYPNCTFPHLGEETPCPLCQQPLGQGADRLVRFEHFVRQEAEKSADARKAELAEAVADFKQRDPSLAVDDELLTEIASLDAALAAALREYDAALERRHKAIAESLASGDWATVSALPDGPGPSLKIVTANVVTEANTLEGAADEIARATLQQQFEELEARRRLAVVKGAVLTAITRMDRREKLNACQSSLKTNAISLKASDLTEKVVSKELETALNEEFKCLGVANLQVQLKSRSDKGKALHKLRLNLPQARAPGEILSEGEQRAVAIGSFLAEIRLGGGLGGIVFDDPVSSLDHKRREKVARRFAKEALRRQVIVFTHDIYFLSLLRDEAKRQGCAMSSHSLECRPQGVGVPSAELPFEAVNTKQRLATLRNRLPTLKSLHESGDDPEYRKQTALLYSELRISWERAVEEVLLNEVVVRFRKGVETNRLATVTVEDDDYRAVFDGMSRCSNYCHDQALLGGVEMPSPNEVLKDIESLGAWRDRTVKRGEKLQAARKAGPTAVIGS